MKTVGIAGSTGSIGRNALSVLQELEGFRIKFLACYSNIDLLLKQAERFKPDAICILDDELAGKVDTPLTLKIGFQGLYELVEEGVDILLIALTGTRVIDTLLLALEKGIRIAMANKETLVAYGPILREKISKGEVIPVDSEHSAIFQALHAGRRTDLRRIILTASGGPFREREELTNITPEEALNHPTWDMGKKITIDSATLFNKGLEAHEAKTLFDVEPDRIEVIIHPQSIIHSIVEFVDGSMVAQMSIPDMRIPIQFAFTYPERKRTPVNALNLIEVGSLNFEPPDMKRFPLLRLALDMLKEENTLPAVMSRADEVAVNAFLQCKIDFKDIYTVVEKTVSAHQPWKIRNIEDVKDAEKWAEEYAERLIG